MSAPEPRLVHPGRWGRANIAPGFLLRGRGRRSSLDFEGTGASGGKARFFGNSHRCQPSARFIWHIIWDFSRACRGSRRNRARRLYHRVFGDGFAEVSCAEFRGPLPRLEVDIDEAEAGCKALAPLEIVHQAPEKVAFYRHALRGRPVQMSEVVAKKHDTIGVVDDPLS